MILILLITKDNLSIIIFTTKGGKNTEKLCVNERMASLKMTQLDSVGSGSMETKLYLSENLKYFI